MAIIYWTIINKNNDAEQFIYSFINIQNKYPKQKNDVPVCNKFVSRLVFIISYFIYFYQTIRKIYYITRYLWRQAYDLCLFKLRLWFYAYSKIPSFQTNQNEKGAIYSNLF